MVRSFMVKTAYVIYIISVALCSAMDYYVSISEGNDTNPGTLQNEPLKSISKVNSLLLNPGDRVLFKSGDVWHGEMLELKRSGVAGSPIIIGCYPEGATVYPVISGSVAISGWTLYSGNIYMAKLNAGDNTGKFPFGVNQLFRNGNRLTCARWPNIGDVNGGYSTIDGFPSGNTITDEQLPSGNWTGGSVHVRGMNWYIENRTIIASSGANLTLNEGIECEQNPNADCSGWGYFINNALPAVDIEGEWCYEKSTSTIYLHSSNGAPSSTVIEGSIVLKNDDRYWGGITIGVDLGAEISYVNICNLDIRNWYCNGIAIPTNLQKTEISYVTIKNCFISDVDGSGINLATWVYDAMDGGSSGWRGGSHLQILNNTITGANRFGINCYSVYSIISGNRIARIGLLENVSWAGLGCSITDNGGMCTEDGSGIRIKVSDQPKEAGSYDTICNNFIDSVGYCGMDIFGKNNMISKNIIRSALSTKQDGGGIRVFGDNAKSITIDSNTIIDAIGNWYGTASEFNKPFGFGIYIDRNAAFVNSTANTIFNSSAGAILYQNASGNCAANIMYTNSKEYTSAQMLNIGGTSNVTQNGNITGFDSTSEIFFNDTWIEKTVNLGNKPYLNLQHESVQGSISLTPFTSIILLPEISVKSWEPLTCKTDAERISIIPCHGDVIFRAGKNCTGVEIYLLNGAHTAATLVRNGVGDWKTRKMSKGVYIAKFKLKGHAEIRKFWVL